MTKRIIQPSEFDDFLRGLVIYGTGGGGDEDWGRLLLENDLKRGRVCEIVDPKDVPDDAFICSGGLMGSVKSLEGMSYEDITLGWEDNFPLTTAIKTMEKIMKKKVDYIIPFEVGALNTTVMMSAAACLGIPMLDGDLIGRSTPETHMTAPIGNGVSLYPMPLLDRHGNTTIVMHSDSPTYADEVGRFVVVKGGGLGANAHYPMTGKQVKEAIVPNTVTRAIEFGRIIAEANKGGKDPVEAFAKEVSGDLLFEGTITEMFGEDKGGFYLTNLVMEGKGAFAGKKLKMIVKNESMIIWIDDKLSIMLPDCAFMLDPKTGAGIPSIAHKVGLEMAIVGADCHPRVSKCMESELGRIAFGADRYGCPELSYIPYSQLKR